MRTLVMTVFIILATALEAKGESDLYRIIRLSTPTIVIGGHELSCNDTFRADEHIQWDKTGNQAMVVKNVETGSIYRFSAQVFESKKKPLHSIADFFLHTNKASTRDTDGVLPVLQPSPVKDNFPEKRIALVIGNSDYTDQTSLRNAQKDAEDMASTLLNLGFDVIQAYECNYTEMKTALNRFASLAGEYDVALFYYSGHGVQEAGQNYLVPVNAKLEYRSELRECLNCSDVVDKLDNSGCPSRMVFFDACRDMRTSWTRSTVSGLAKMEGSAGTVITFSTQNGNVADDGDGENSPFAFALMDNMCKPQVTFSEMMTNVVRDTYNLTGQKQCPVQIGTLIYNFSFNPSGDEIKPAETLTAAPSVTAAPLPAPTPERRVMSQPKTVFDTPDVDVKVASCHRSGNNCIIDIVMTNNTRRDLNPSILRSEPTAGGNSVTAAYDDRGNSPEMRITPSNGQWQDFVLPVGVPVSVRVVLRDVAEDARTFMLNFALRGMNMAEAYGIASLRIRDIPVGYTAESSGRRLSDGQPTVTFDTPDVDVAVSACRRSGTVGIMYLTFTNNTGRDISPLVLAEEPCNGFVSNYTKAFDSEGNVVAYNDGLSVTTASGSNNIVLPDGVPVKLRVTIKGLSPDAGSLQLLSITFREMNKDEVYGISLLRARNIPVE